MSRKTRTLRSGARQVRCTRGKPDSAVPSWFGRPDRVKQRDGRPLSVQHWSEMTSASSYTKKKNFHSFQKSLSRIFMFVRLLLRSDPQNTFPCQIEPSREVGRVRTAQRPRCIEFLRPHFKKWFHTQSWVGPSRSPQCQC